MSGSIIAAVTIILVAVAVVGIVIGLLKRYKRCPSDQLLVIYGKTKGDSAAQVIHGGAQFVWPVIQDYAYLDLKPMNMDIDLKGALSSQNIRVDVPSSVTISISNEESVMQNAATHLLGLRRDDIEQQAREIIFGQMRQVISNMTIEEINTDRDTFLENIHTNLGEELQKIGLKLINVNVQDIKDESGYISALGKEAAAKAVNEAKIKVAEETRTGDIGSAKAEQDRRTQVAKSIAEAEIGEADAQANQRIKTSDANSKAVAGENKAAIDIANSDSERKVKEAEAKKKAVSAAKVQEAKAYEEAYAAEKDAEDARAEKEKSKLVADVVVPAEIDKQKVEVDAEAEAERIRRIAVGEADATLAKMTAQGEGIRKILTGTADGIKSIVNAAGGDPYAAVQLILADKAEDLMKIQTEAIKGINIDEIKVWDSGQGGTSTSGWVQDFLKVAPQFKDIFEMVGAELPNHLQGAGEKAKAISQASMVKEETDSNTEEESTDTSN